MIIYVVTTVDDRDISEIRAVFNTRELALEWMGPFSHKYHIKEYQLNCLTGRRKLRATARFNTQDSSFEYYIDDVPGQDYLDERIFHLSLHSGVFIGIYFDEDIGAEAARKILMDKETELRACYPYELFKFGFYNRTTLWLEEERHSYSPMYRNLRKL